MATEGVDQGEITPEIALALVRRALNSHYVQDADLEDIASAALLAHWMDVARGKEGTRIQSFFRDLKDAWRTFRGVRNKRPEPWLVTNWEDWWWEGQAAN